MSLEREAFSDAAQQATAAEQFDDIPVEPLPQGPGVRVSDLLPDMSFLLAETGDGPIEDYIEHPLNFNQSKGVAQILRGVTGIAGKLNYAILDIGLGMVQVMKEGKTIEKVTNTEQ